MGNCVNRNHSKSILTNPVYPNKIYLEITERDSTGLEYDKTRLTFTPSPPSQQYYQCFYVEDKALMISGTVLPGQDPKGFVKKPVQDHYIITKAANSTLICLFDGHGANGQAIVHFCGHFVSTYFATHIESFEADSRKAIVQMVEACDEALNAQKDSCDANLSGTTAVVIYLDAFGYSVANLGDSKAVLARDSLSTPSSPTPPKFRSKFIRSVEPSRNLQVISLTECQNLENSEEKSRVEAAGGVCKPLKDKLGRNLGPLRIWKSGRSYPGLVVTRSLGDKIGKTIGVSATPTVEQHSWATGKDSFVVLASDGVWDVMNEQEVIDFVEKFRKKAAQGMESSVEYPVTLENASIAQILAEEARFRWYALCENEDVVIDDISAVIVELTDFSLYQETAFSEGITSDTPQIKWNPTNFN